MPKKRDSIGTLLERLAKAQAQFRPFIESIRFPYYRSLEPGSEIDFGFPVSVFIGRNGTGKSSTLQALYGSVRGRSVGDYWFATSVDTVVDQHQGLEQSFVYRYRLEDGGTAEVLKLRRKREGNPDYWEAEGPLQKYGLDPSGKRAEPANMPVLYLDFRAELSAFDKFFYFPDEQKLAHLDKLKKERDRARQRRQKRARRYSKQDYIRNRSQQVRRILDGKTDIVSLQFKTADEKTRTVEKSRPAERLSDPALAEINHILDKSYQSGLVLEHCLYGNQWGKTVVFKTQNTIGGEYSEAFAGSGEVAVTIIVHALTQAAPHTLVLLDEPEVSLHPTAQERLMRFLYEQCLTKQLQIVISTHSPSLAKHLPQEAIKVFRSDDSARVRIEQGFTADEAFREIDTSREPNLILVEDARTKILLEAALRQAGGNAPQSHRVEVSPGGCSAIWSDIAVYCRRDVAPKVVFDGDQNPHEAIDPGAVRRDESNDQLNRRIKMLTKGNDKEGPNLNWVGENDAGRREHMVQFLEFMRSRVCYLPARTPEELVWDSEHVATLLQRHGVPPTFVAECERVSSVKDRIQTS